MWERSVYKILQHNLSILKIMLKMAAFHQAGKNFFGMFLLVS